MLGRIPIRWPGVRPVQKRGEGCGEVRRSRSRWPDEEGTRRLMGARCRLLSRRVINHNRTARGAPWSIPLVHCFSRARCVQVDDKNIGDLGVFPLDGLVRGKRTYKNILVPGGQVQPLACPSCTAHPPPQSLYSQHLLWQWSSFGASLRVSMRRELLSCMWKRRVHDVLTFIRHPSYSRRTNLTCL